MGVNISLKWVLRRFGEPSRDRIMGMQFMPDSTVTDRRQYYASEEALYFLLVLANIGVIFFSLSTMITWVY